MITGKNLKNVNLKDVRGMEGVKKAEINIKGFKAKIAVINGTGNAEKILKELKKNPKAYDAVEVMACPGGCIGGGGQPLPSTPEIRKQRAEALYRIDAKKKLRLAHESPIVKKVYKEFLNNEKIIHKICHTKYHKKTREVKI
jgi:NADH-quinone oxidoreductase subunit G